MGLRRPDHERLVSTAPTDCKHAADAYISPSYSRFGMYSVDHGINAGLDLEMPGTNKWRTLELVSRSIAARKVTVRTIKERARKVLELVQRCAKEAPEVDSSLSITQKQLTELLQVLDGDGQEYTRESEDDKILMRKVAAESIVLLRNENRVLPLKPAGLKKIAIVGANAKAFVLSGGGSAALKPSYFVSPYDGIVNALPKSIEVTYSEGARGTAACSPKNPLIGVDKF